MPSERPGIRSTDPNHRPRDESAEEDIGVDGDPETLGKRHDRGRADWREASKPTPRHERGRATGGSWHSRPRREWVTSSSLQAHAVGRWSLRGPEEAAWV